jgi:formamidopyrimidine-DNA glycosylase
LPELPEVETIRRGLIPRLVGCTIKRVVLSNRRLRLPVPRAKLKGWVQGSQVQSVERRAKYLLVKMNSGAVLVLHLGMTGRLAFFSNGTPRRPHDHLRFLLDSGLELRFNDVRRFGSVQVLAPGDGEKSQIFAGLGAEPLGADFSTPYLMKRARNRTKPIKNFLMDAKVVVGIGNIYANEILFVAGIKPTRAAGTLGRTAWDKVVKASRQVLEQAIACGGTTISDYVNSSGEAGYFQCELKVYGRGGEKCQSCGSEISRVVLSGRASFYCPRCQR